MTATSVAVRDRDHQICAARACSENLSVSNVAEKELLVPLAVRLGAESLGDLLNPLRDRLQASLGFVEILAEQTNGRLYRAERRFVERARSGLHSLDLSLSNLIEAASAVSGTDYVGRETLAIKDLMCDMMPVLEDTCRRRRVALKVAVKNPELRICSDWRRLRSIALNLASAAAERLSDGELSVGIQLVRRRRRRLGGQARGCAELKLELRGRNSGPAKPRSAQSASSSGFPQLLNFGCEVDLTLLLARYHIAAVGGVLHLPGAPSAAFTLAAFIPVKPMTRDGA